MLVVISLCCFGYLADAQDYPINTIHKDTIQTCSGTFYDSGSDLGSYGSNEKFVTTFQAPSGQRIVFSFTSFNLRSEGGDTLKIFDGSDTLSALIGIYTGEGVSFAIESTDSALTFLFTSDGSLENSGWAASINCCLIPVTSPVSGSTSECVNVTGVGYSVTDTPGSTYQWFITGGTQSGGMNTRSITIDWGSLSGSAGIKVVENNGCTSGDTVNLDVVLHDLPVVSFSGLDSVYQITELPITLTGDPISGTFTGDGITGNQFDPSAAGLGLHEIIYSYTDVNTCENSYKQYVDVRNFNQQTGAIWLIDLNNWCSFNAQFTNTSATADGTSPACWTGGTGNNVWFKFVASTNSVNVEVKTGGVFGSMRGQQIAIWNANNTLVKCIESADYFAGTLPLSIDTLTVGHTYWISVDDRRTHGTFSLCIDDSPSFDYKSGAFEIVDINNYCSADAAFDNTYATVDESAGNCWTGGTGNNVWFKFIALSNGVFVNVTTGGVIGTMRGQQIALWNDTGVQVGCANAADYYAGSLTLSSDTLTTGHTYYISVDDRRTHGSFKICVNDSLSYDYQSGAVVLSDIMDFQSNNGEYSNNYMTPDGNTPSCWTGGVGNNVWFEFVAENEVVKIDVITGGTYGTMRGQQIALWNQAGDLVKCANSADYFSGTLTLQTDTLTIGNTYWISVDDRRTNGTFTIAIDNEVGYDYKIGAVYLIDLEDWSSADALYENVYATPDENAGSCWTGGVGNNVWFKFEAETPAITISVLTGGSKGTMRGQQIALWNENNDQVGCVNAADYYAGTLTLSADTLTVGHYYWISVDDRRTQGSFTLEIDNTVPFDLKNGAILLNDLDHWCSSDAVYDNTYATADENAGSCWTGSTNNNVWFKFVAISGEIQIDIKTGGSYGSMRGQQIALWTAAGVEINCANAADYYAGTLTLTSGSLTPGNTYYISVDDRRTHGTFTLCINNKAGFDYLEGAKTIPHIGSWCSAQANYDNTYATADGNDPGCWTGSVGNNVWFKFTATTSNLTFHVSTGGSYGTMRGQQIAIWNEAGDLVKCANSADYYAGILPLSIDTLTTGHTYYVSVDDRRTHGTFTICASNLIDYDYKAGALELSDISNWSSANAAYDNTYATDDEIAGSCWSGGAGNNVWFKFVATTNSVSVDVSTGGIYGSMRGQQIAIWNDEGTEVKCADAADYYAGTLSVSSDTLTIGHTYYISVDDRRTHGTFTLSIDNTPNYDFKQGAILLTDLDNWTSAQEAYTNTYATADESAGNCWTAGVGNNVWFKFVAISGEIETRVITGGSDGTMRGQQIALWNEAGIQLQCVNADDYFAGTLTATIDTLTAGNTYYISVDDRRTHGTFTLYVNNKVGFDFKSGAVELNDLDNWCSANAAYTNRFASQGEAYGTCWSGTSIANVWFTFKALFDTFSVDVITGGAFGTMRGQQIAVWNENNVQVGCANAADYFAGTLTLQIDTLTPGHTYWIGIDDRRTAGSFSLCVNNVSDIEYWAIADSNWDVAGNWSHTEGGPPATTAPSAANNVHIRGYSITVRDVQSCANLNVDVANNNTNLTIDGGTLMVNGDLNFTNSGGNYPGNIALVNSGTISITNDMIFDRSGGNEEFSITLYDNAEINLNNDLNITSSAGSTTDIKIELNNSARLNIGNNLVMANTGGPKIYISGNNNAVIDVDNHIVFDGTTSDQIEIELNTDATLYLAGNFNRGTSAYGVLDCNDNSTLVFNGQSFIQTFPENTGGGTDNFSYQNVTVNNTKVTSPQVVLDGDVSVYGTLTLVRGVVRTTASNMLTIENNATVAGASSLSYVYGPLKKTGNQSFKFDIGDADLYKPIAVSAPANSTDAFIAEYANDNPHPSYDTTVHEAGITYINSCEYWTLTRASGSSDIDATVFWDANSCCISNLTDLKVAVWDGSLWKDHGNDGTTGTTASGSIITASNLPYNFSVLTFANSLPTVSFSGLAVHYCENHGDIVLTGSPNDDIQTFSGPGITDNGDGTATFSPSGVNAGTYYITYTYTNSISGCSNSSVQSVTILPRPTANMFGSDSICAGGSAELSMLFTGTAPWDYTYTDGTNFFSGSTSANPFEFLTSNTGTYAVTALQDANGCIGNNFGLSATVDEYSLVGKPTITPSGATTFCEGTNVILTSSVSPTFYLWSNGEITQSISVDESGDFSVRIRNNNGCLSEWSDTIEVIVNPLPGKAGRPSGDNSVCHYTLYETYTTPGAADAIPTEYVWTLSPPEAGIITGNSISAFVTWDNAFTGVATITVQGHNACGFGPVSNPLLVTINSAPLVDLGADREICGSEILDAGNPGSGYLWSTGAVSQTLTVSITGSYWVRVTSGNGCIDRDTVTITVSAASSITDQPDNQTLCVGDNMHLNIVVSGSGPYTYQWKKDGSDLFDGGDTSGSQTAALTINNAQSSNSGNYTCVVTSLCGAITSDIAVVNIYRIPVTGPLYHIHNDFGQ
ncbi:MAG: immunoglobulin domain-containing protein [Bacteroidales bacterium]